MHAKHPVCLPLALELPNGESVTLRMIHPDDAPLLLEMYRNLSPRSRRLRYHGFSAEMTQEQAITLSQCDPARQLAVVAVHQDGKGEQIVGESRFARASAHTVEAETAIVIRDDFQGLGLGAQLFVVLLSTAHAMGIERMFGWVMPENRHMLHLLRKTRLPLRIEHHAGEMLVEVDLGGDETAGP
jgi:acetyltransferase